jgi:hypothetical protein
MLGKCNGILEVAHNGLTQLEDRLAAAEGVWARQTNQTKVIVGAERATAPLGAVQMVLAAVGMVQHGWWW